MAATAMACSFFMTPLVRMLWACEDGQQNNTATAINVQVRPHAAKAQGHSTLPGDPCSDALTFRIYQGESRWYWVQVC